MVGFSIHDPSLLGDYATFSDESGVSKHRYLLIGGVSCASRDASLFHSKVHQIRAASPFPMDSLQWKNLSSHKKLASYSTLLDFFFEKNCQHKLDFTCLVIDTHRLDHRSHNDGDAELFFQKMVFNYVKALCALYSPPEIIRCFHGRRSSKFELQQVREIINSALARRKGTVLFRPLRQLEYANVSASGLHQLTDVLLGCVAYHWNASMRRNPGSAKSALAKYAQAESPSHRLDQLSPKSLRHFNIWPLRLQDPQA